MPLREGLTMDDVIKTICVTATGPKRAREAGLAPDTDEQIKHEISHSNACVFVLMALGLNGDEIRQAFAKTPSMPVGN